MFNDSSWSSLAVYHSISTSSLPRWWDQVYVMEWVGHTCITYHTFLFFIIHNPFTDAYRTKKLICPMCISPIWTKTSKQLGQALFYTLATQLQTLTVISYPPPVIIIFMAKGKVCPYLFCVIGCLAYWRG